jgi:hypothetical protein
MRQVHIPAPAGRFWTCSKCSTEPRHVEHHGRTLRETMQKNVPATRHSLECRCGRSTGLCGSLEDAESDWGKRYTQMPLALALPAPAAPGRRVVNMRQVGRKAATA